MKTIQLKDAIINTDIINLINNKLPIATLNYNGLAGSDLIKAFNFKSANIANGESDTIGLVCGLCVIKHGWSGSLPSVVLVENYYKRIIQIAGKNYREIPCEYIWIDKGGDNSLIELSIKSTYTTTLSKTDFLFAFQRLI